MLIPLADVPRWYAERKPKDTIAVSHGDEAITWNQLERNANRRARAFAERGVSPGDFVAIGLPNSNAFYETTFAVWKCGATPTGGSTGRPKVILDHNPAVTETSVPPGLEIPIGASLLNPGPLYHNAPFILSHLALFAGG